MTMPLELPYALSVWATTKAGLLELVTEALDTAQRMNATSMSTVASHTGMYVCRGPGAWTGSVPAGALSAAGQELRELVTDAARYRALRAGVVADCVSVVRELPPHARTRHGEGTAILDAPTLDRTADELVAKFRGAR